MKLLEALRQQIAVEQKKVADLFAKEVGFKSANDINTVIEKNNAKNTWKWLVKNKQLLLDSFPKENVKKLMLLNKIDANTDLGIILTIFKQILRSQKARLISRKRYDWNVEQRRQSYCLEYRIISATPDLSNFVTKKRKATDIIETKETKQTKQTNQTQEISDTNVSNTNISNTNISSTNISKATVLEISSVISEVPEVPEVTDHLDTKQSETNTVTKETHEILNTQEISNTSVSKAKVLDTRVPDTRVLDTSPSLSKSPTVVHSPPQALSPTGGV